MTRQNETVYNQTLLKVRNETEEGKRKQKAYEKELIEKYEVRLLQNENRIKIMVQEIERLNQAIALKNK